MESNNEEGNEIDKSDTKFEVSWRIQESDDPVYSQKPPQFQQAKERKWAYFRSVKSFNYEVDRNSGTEIN